MASTKINYSKFMYDIMNMCNRKEWEDKFDQNKKELNDFFEDLHNLSENDVFDRTSEHGDYVLGQLTGFCIETFLARYFSDGSNITDAFLKRFKHRMSRDDIKIYQKIKNIYFSVYKIVDVKKNEVTVLKDILFDTDEIKIIECMGSQPELIGRHILASIIEEDGLYYFTGIILHLNENIINEMTYSIKQEIKKLKLTFKGFEIPDIEKIKPLLYKYYPTFFYYAFSPFVIKPIVLNPNGDEFGPANCKFKIKNPQINKNKIANILDSLYDKKDYQIYNEGEDKWSLHILRDTSKKYKKADLSVEDYIVYADISIEEDYLNLLVLYSTAMNKIIDILKKNLKDLIGIAIIDNVDLDDIELDGNEDDLEDIPAEVKAELLKKFFDKHLKDTLKIKIPILNNLTPKQCLKKDPETFYKWWNGFEENIKKQTYGLYDYAWFMNEIGLK